MRHPIALALFLCIPFLLSAQQADEIKSNRITSIIDSSDTNNMVLVQSFIVNVPVDSVWDAYSTKKGWESWATAIAELDFRINGLIRTNYNIEGKIGDESTITLHIINYVPKQMLTLQAELTKNFPQIMQEDEKDLFNVVLFQPLSDDQTKVISYGIGYKKNEKYMSLMNFFIQGNEQSYLNLISYLESGVPSVKY